MLMISLIFSVSFSRHRRRPMDGVTDALIGPAPTNVVGHCFVNVFV
jgi:hypothetical protein